MKQQTRVWKSERGVLNTTHVHKQQALLASIQRWGVSLQRQVFLAWRTVRGLNICVAATFRCLISCALRALTHLFTRTHIRVRSLRIKA
jgi:hypothetical protein